ncbi:DUF3501 family protein [Haliangium ochraceum]|uniref:DUF3501 family protein n=1 Tax=Haliangium ochraceum (strain DSM 14365 / JCM 11303 / SMP-2) TaxID=502025 RepID=D0LXP9_HALO1|nr:DUF3501 family protein [Haliangium ochraceum]ACY17804.1 conserved hypothetical protein [Haliangium ochraceum DSM 14365]
MCTPDIRRSDLLSLEAYEKQRSSYVARIITLKKRRRLSLGPHMSLLLENRRTLLFQIQETLRIAGITDERRIGEVVSEFGALLPPPGTLLATLFLEFTSNQQASGILAPGVSFDASTFLRIGHRRIAARYLREPGEPALAAVNYLHIDLDRSQRARLVHTSVPLAFELAHPSYRHAAIVPSPMRREMALDIGMPQPTWGLAAQTFA